MIVSQKEWELPNAPILIYWQTLEYWRRSKFSLHDEHGDQLFHLSWEGFKKCKTSGLTLLSDTKAASFLYIHDWLFQTFSSLTPPQGGSPALRSLRARHVLRFLSYQHQMIDDESYYVQVFCAGGRSIHSLSFLILFSTKTRLDCQNNLLTTSSSSTSDKGCIQNSVLALKRLQNLIPTARRLSLFQFRFCIIHKFWLSYLLSAK